MKAVGDFSRSQRSVATECSSIGACRSPAALPSVRLRNIRPAGRLRPIRASVNTVVQCLEPKFKTYLVFLPCHSVHARSLLERVECGQESTDADMVEDRGEPLLLSQACGLPYTIQRP